ncbi:hypothetical protein [Acinetobacter pittii]|uniref:hypothetical protein n=1 Tax=Acinetobacter pittii TaxID=48296 RepID=UPI000E6AACCC|nr:hypothetical protein [Acinetobacter pittii]
MENLKIDCCGFTDKQKQEVVMELNRLGFITGHKSVDFYCFIYGCTGNTAYNNTIQFGNTAKTFAKNKGRELTLPQLRDLVAQSKSKVREYLDPNDNYKLCLINPSDAAHWMIEVPDEAELYVYWPHDKDYHFQSGQGFYEDGGWNLCSFSVEEIKKGDAGAEILWSREPIQEQGLISGADALRALADGKDVQWATGDEFQDVTGQWEIREFSHPSFRFRIKPQTIKLELELPKPFEPKDGDIYWFITCRTGKGYSCRNHKARHGDSGMQFGAYRTEDEIKQVVEQLRKIRGTNS